MGGCAIHEVLVSSPPAPQKIFTRRDLFRGLFKTAVCGFAGTIFYAGEIDRHWLETSHRELRLEGLAAEFDGFHAVQLSDIHLEEFTEPFFLREAVNRINQLHPDAVFLTGDFVTHEFGSEKFAVGSAWKCAEILAGLECPQRYAIFGNHDVQVGEEPVGEALSAHGITVLRNSFVPIQRGSARFWLAGLDDPLFGNPDIDAAIPVTVRNQRNEPVVLLAHEPDYVQEILKHPAGQSVGLTLSGHTHGGQVRIPFLPPLHLPPMGQRYVEGLFRLGEMQLYVSRGLGTVGVPFRFNCPPELASFTLRA